MPHNTTLIATIVASLVFAFGAGFLAHRLRLPPLVGYLVAGVAVGPFTPGIIADADMAGQLAEIGVILLMFGVGLHFSVKDLLAVYPVAVPGALAQMAVVLPAGAGLGLAWGWGAGAGLLLGLALSVASTVVLLRVLDERGSLDAGEGRIAVGWLIVQDLAMVLALVLLPALAGRGAGAGLAGAGLAGEGLAGEGLAGEGLAGEALARGVALTVAKVGTFGVLTVLVGRRAVPWLLAVVARTGSRELFTLAVLACALGIAYGSAHLFGVSLALGAFFAGVVLSESDLSHQAAADCLPLQDAFAVLFFVSVGMLFDPMILAREPLRVAAVVAVIVLVKSVPAALVLLAARQPLRETATIVLGLAQVGEFSFILAALGVRLEVLPPEGRDLILAGALLSIVLNVPLIALADRTMRWLRDRPDTLARLDRRASPLATAQPAAHAGLRDHAVIVGHGRVGGLIRRALADQDLPFVIVERDRRTVEALRERGLPTIWGDASAPGILDAAGVARARLVVVAAPDGFQARSAILAARRVNPGIDIVVRTHSESELAYLERQGVGMAAMGERELALTMSDYALRSFGLSDERIRLAVSGLRTRAGSGRSRERPGAAPDGHAARKPDDREPALPEPRGAPELQPREAEDRGAA